MYYLCLASVHAVIPPKTITYSIFVSIFWNFNKYQWRKPIHRGSDQSKAVGVRAAPVHLTEERQKPPKDSEKILLKTAQKNANFQKTFIKVQQKNTNFW